MITNMYISKYFNVNSSKVIIKSSYCFIVSGFIVFISVIFKLLIRQDFNIVQEELSNTTHLLTRLTHDQQTKMYKKKKTK